jgi:hypothetical protein
MKKILFIIFAVLIFMIAFIGSSQAIPTVDDINLTLVGNKKLNTTVTVEYSYPHPIQNLTKVITNSTPSDDGSIDESDFVNSVALNPEPSTLLLLVIGLVFILILRKNNYSKS